MMHAGCGFWKADGPEIRQLANCGGVQQGLHGPSYRRWDSWQMSIGAATHVDCPGGLPAYRLTAKPHKQRLVGVPHRQRAAQTI